MNINPEYKPPPKPLETGKEKLNRAAEVAKQLFKGTSKGAFPLIEHYRPEVLDREHRYAGSIHPYWKVWSSAEKIEDNFTTWLNRLEKGEKPSGFDELVTALPRGTNVAEAIQKMPRVQYLNAEEREKYRLQLDADGDLFNQIFGKIPNGEYIVVEGLDGHLYLGKRETGLFQHSSFFGGSPVKSAGEVSAEDHSISEFRDKTGHYQAWRYPEMTYNAVRAFERIGIEPRSYKVIRNAGLDPRQMKQHKLKVMEYRSALHFLRDYKT